jgi:hypothetical protein
MIAFSGAAFEHGANCDGDRACIAFYMKDNVMNRLGLPIATWLDIREYCFTPESDNYEPGYVY